MLEQKLDAILEYLYSAYLESKQSKTIDDGEGNIVRYHHNPQDALKGTVYIIFYLSNKFPADDIYDVRSLLDRLLTDKMITSKIGGVSEYLYTIENKGIDFFRNDGYEKTQYIKQLQFSQLEKAVKFWKDPRYWFGFLSAIITMLIAVLATYVSWKHK